MSSFVGYLWPAIDIPCYFYENQDFSFLAKMTQDVLWQPVDSPQIYCVPYSPLEGVLYLQNSLVKESLF